MSGAIDKGSRAGRRAAVGLAVFLLAGAALVMLDEGSRYLWIKALHVIAVISWMAGMLYMPRLFIYHVDAEPGSVQASTFSVMERRLFRIIMTPAMVLSWIFGLYLAWNGYGFAAGWLHLKLLAVVALTVAHIYFGRAVGAFEKGNYIRDGRYWRIMNEVPTVLMIVIVILVVVKPF